MIFWLVGGADEKGFAVADLLFALAVTLLVGAVMVSTLGVAIAAWLNSTAALETFTMASEAADFIVRDVRIAGFNPRGAGFAGIAYADAASLELLADLDGNGTVDPNSAERIRYRVGSTGDSIMRVVGEQSMPILDSLERGGFSLRYFDSAGAEIGGPLPLDSAQLGSIRGVEVTLRARRSGQSRPVLLTVFATRRNP